MYVMPTMPLSMASGLRKTPVFNTLKQKSAAGITSAVALMPYPTWQFEFSLDNIIGFEQTSSSIVAEFFATYMATCGGANLFLFSDPQDHTVSGAQFGIGNGTSTAFQISRNINGQVDIVQNVNGSPTITINGTGTSAWTISSTGVVTFTTAPANNAILKWSGSFYYACRFADDTLDSTRCFTISNGLDHWNIQGIKFSSEFLTTSGYGNIAAPGGV